MQISRSGIGIDARLTTRRSNNRGCRELIIVWFSVSFPSAPSDSSIGSGHIGSQRRTVGVSDYGN